YENAEVPLNSSFSFRGTGSVSGTLKALYIKEGDIRVDIALFRSALLVIDPKETVEGLEIHVNGRKVRNASSLFLPEKLDVSAELVPASENVLDFSAKNGLLEWKLILD
ncbi:MAG: hypothetical protein J7M14_02455, partial [Planctomycetes bacterium]|nr:hypothetical protein [Planctomycetota bacterium]